MASSETSETPDMMVRFMQSGQVFTPSAPIDNQALFAGRVNQLNRIIGAVSQRGQHAILFGERGVGKTSLANVLLKRLRGFQDQFRSVIVNCDTEDRFDQLWHKIFLELENTQTLDFEPHQINPEFIRVRLQRQITGSAIIIVDEMDRVNRDPYFTAFMADTIKTISDHSINATIILVGVANAVEDLIAEHLSIERALIQIQMPRMSPDELTEIIRKGLELLLMTMDQTVIQAIVFLAQGLPNYVHLLSLYAVQSAIRENSSNVNVNHLSKAIKQACENAQHSIMSTYSTSIFSSRQETIYPKVLLACALAQKDETGCFRAVDVRDPLSRLVGKEYTTTSAFNRQLNQFCEDARGKILEKKGVERYYRFRFTNAMMPPYIIMEGLRTGIINLDQFKP
ncbi:MAG: ATP-binding protein [Pseudanabaena sp. ELA645]|jgi:Cdc6-like AAA superfamily ATPase